MRTIAISLSMILALGLSATTAHAANAPDEKTVQEMTASLLKEGGTVFPVGVENTGYAKWFTGMTYLSSLTPKESNIGVSNVTFAPGVINFWHTHQGSCQILIGVSGKGWYQIWGEPAKEMKPGETVTIPEGAKHWHGAADGSWFQHLAIMTAGAGTTWMQPVDPKEYQHLLKK